ncbi:NADH-quinone oxidoreductase subunit B family protein [Desulforhopalus singaporensis]|uniref:Ni,Fe-hydrogenase III small subunit n=1 Tax=Desulforhopalus singaporensis TaxID=91360 RepID=A0A1H0SB84_9BACT|nr:hydrogenase [Desulforhopalus singaporensis]SDP39023.1 Ni,Fe-hydrogenase III small subunit [Desulforhopalus singaporensis]
MLKIIKNRFEQGCKTSEYPKKPISLYRRYRGMPVINGQCSEEIVDRCAALCPQDAINSEEKSIDLGRCVFCGQCEAEGDGEFVRFSTNFELGSASRKALVTTGEMPDLADHSRRHFKKLFGRSLQLRQVSAAGCNSCEADTNVLNTPFFDLSRFGIDFVASPRHADGIHVTGPVSRNMKQALLATYEAVPSPKVVIASGSCAISGGPFYGSDEIVGDLNSLIPVDLYIPGCPPHPLTTLHALLKFFKQ